VTDCEDEVKLCWACGCKSFYFLF